MTREELQALKSKIKAMIIKSETDIKDMEAMTQPISPENAIGRISRMDAINNKSVMEAVLRNKKRKLYKLKIALANADKEGFGICSNCKKPIQLGRLILMPESNHCIKCAGR